MTVSSHSRTYIDYSEEKSTLGFYVPQINAGNLATVNTNIGAIGVAILDLTTLALDRTQTVLSFAASNPTPPTDPYAQREMKWLVSYRDTVTGRQYQMEIGGANLTDNLLPGTDKADLDSADWAAFVTAFEAGAVSQDGNAVEVLSAYFVGRNI